MCQQLFKEKTDLNHLRPTNYSSCPFIFRVLQALQVQSSLKRLTLLSCKRLQSVKSKTIKKEDSMVRLLVATLMLTCGFTFAEQQKYDLEFFTDPAPGWSKNRLAGRLLEGNGGFAIYDMKPDAEPFDDAETFKIDSPITLPYGNKRITIDVVVEAGFEPLWGNRLMQFQLNGAELEVGVNAQGEPSFTKEFGDDGKGFVPAVTGTYTFEIDKALTDVQFVSFMTAGASGFNMTVKNVSIDVWPEEDLRPRPYLMRFNRLGYLTDQPQPMILEWQKDLVAESLPFTLRQANSGEKTIELTRTTESRDAGLPITPLELGLSTADYNTMIIPETVKRTKHTSVLFRTRDSLSEYEKARDLALGAFHWYDMRTYEGAHQQDTFANVFGTDLKKDVYGGWYDAGDYGRYSVNGAWSVYMMLLSYASDNDAFPAKITPLTRTDDARVALLDLVLPELEFLAKMQRDDGAVYHKVNSRDWPGNTVKPTDDLDEKFIMPVSTTATADVAAVMNLASYLFGISDLNSDQLLAKKFATVAEKAEQFLAGNPDLIMIDDKYDGYEYGGPYTDQDDSDERNLLNVSKLWTGGTLTLEEKEALLSLAEKERFGDNSPDWMNVNFLSVFTALVAPSDDADFKGRLLSRVETEFSRLMKVQADNPYGLMYAGDEDQFNWGSNGIIATMGTQLLWLENLTGNDAYWQSAYQMSHWFFGLNPHGIIFTTGASRFHAKRPHFRPLISQAAPKPYGLLIGGPNSVELKGDIPASPLFNRAPMQVYIDHQDSWATNEVAINWQAAWASYMTLLMK
jgi:hypothetical protein